MSERIADRLRDQLEQDILTGTYAPGDRLDEVNLARRFEVSRTPIREAFQHLAASGLVDLKPRRGAFVRRPSISEIIEMFEVMAELEGMCGRLASRRMTVSQTAELNEALEACEAACSRGELDTYYYANERFHFLVYSACGNGYLCAQATALHRRLKPYRRLQLRVRGRVRRSLAEHRAIVDAIVNERPQEAEAILKSHILIQGEGFNDLVAGLEREKNGFAETG
ncbi:GntR family transcriptional regulator [Breoghania corrubedonensis]|uniref:GntR family transcriptional regulator n=1 Tax=Breoghania corrubedonensis TaxID=665038 RepID=A0A2T5VFC4_9HYPH|nr:GntR family transcriptional regulator [Breoghania corrubedonensis]PTW62448.1 GntR family transcriptional regulator [Breoghania corrubedonensis]